MQYADLGFIDAGKKYAAEAFSKCNIDTERRCIGNATFVYSIMCLVLIIANVICIYNPNLIISDIAENPQYISIARQLLTILLLTIPLSIIQKFCQMIYSVRLEDYIMHRVMIVGSCIRIASVLYFFTNGRYDIVGYYAFGQFVHIVCLLYVLFNTRKKGYGPCSFFKLIKFDRSAFDSMKGLAFGGFFASLSWMLYYELDLFYISVLLGARSVAIYSIARSVQSFVRSCIGILYTPYVTRFNYCIGVNNMEDLQTVFVKIVKTFAPVIVIPILTIVLFSRAFVLSWVGHEYEMSVILLQLLSLSFIFNYFLSPAGALVYSLKRVRDIYVLAIIQPVVFIMGVLLTVSFLGVNSFAIFKFLASAISSVYYLFVISVVFKFTFRDVMTMLNMKSLFFPVILCAIMCAITLPYFNGFEKTKGHLLIVVATMGTIMVFSLLASLLTNNDLRGIAKDLLVSSKNKLFK